MNLAGYDENLHNQNESMKGKEVWGGKGDEDGEKEKYDRATMPKPLWTSSVDERQQRTLSRSILKP